MGEEGKILIIDDKDNDAQRIKEEVKKYFNDEIIILNQFDSSYLINNKIDLLIMDVQLGYHNGISALKGIQNKLNYKIQVILISTYDGFMFDAFEVNPIGFCRKNNLEKDFCVMVKRLNDIGFRKEIKVNDISIRINTIMYIESHLKHVLLYINDGRKTEVRKKIADFEIELRDNNFCRCHQSFLVNLDYVDRVIKNYIVLKNNEFLSISRKFSHTFIEKCENCKIFCQL